MAQEAGEKFKRGITGHGTLGPMENSNDPNAEPLKTDTHQ